ncbi:protein MANNAN SYNTHESIS-RELATED 1-like [Impatiens glandulifera]|uniref:protein MANNAN SYNTHESIS-RELATED 1-like n=1 Tax=Impatiens glandulifera TaxID=253017 RepID=UPI001FB0E081|nr:protein MANNAN SYNTHESIS-RELATED 1-like [Impatiens glandulifera]XP_047327323.1 protein MANNAN SYNTHESIS-RELATED 1-like [Impatiens glandulifera]XP_047327324.1 protein MANNAN SYNTHESIS-RELATED 1-like [Impatiens glandulifera]XP_047327325.1 protein MANNAN SYNTHESIS-RELATED 1-like [Impatiens glandulifera]
MAVDPRQVLAGILTVTMFVMLGNMIKRDHFDSYESGHADAKAIEHNVISRVTSGPWLEDGSELKPCWKKPVVDDPQESEGFITFSLTNGPEYHVSQIADAVVVAKYLQATLVLPDIRGSNPGDKRNFGDIYDSEKFITSLEGVVKVAKKLPNKVSTKNLAVVRVPNRVTETYIAENVEPIFKSKGNIRLATTFTSVNMKKNEEKSDSDSVTCLAMFGTLELQSEIQEVVDSMVERLRTFSRKTDGRFVAVDLRVDMLEKKGCQASSGSKTKSCYNPSEIALFLRKIGFNKDTTIYLTQSRWDSSLDSLKDLFPKTYTKEGVMPIDMKEKYLSYEISEYEKVIDFYISSQSDVFVPAISGLFYANVAGKRIGNGKHQILVPANVAGSSVADFVSPYVSKKNHLAYSCFC